MAESAPGDIERRLDAARAVAREAGLLALKYYEGRGSLDIEKKGAQDLVSEADREVEALIRRELGGRFAGDAFLGEEHGGGEAPRMWVIDPIDGTANFLRGVPFWCVVLGYVVDGRTELSVTADPLHGHLYWSLRGQGAYRDNTRLEVSKRPPGEACCALTYNFKQQPGPYVELLGKLTAADLDHRRTGSTALNLCHVASGAFDACVSLRCHSWDAVSGLSLVEEAGGIATRWPEGSWTASKAVGASAPACLDAVQNAAGFDLAHGDEAR